jgi:hypothetical protein
MRLTNAAIGLAMIVASGFGAGLAGPAEAGTTVPNGTFEGGFTGGKVTCWNVDAPATTRLTVTPNSHSGVAGYAIGHGRPGTRQVIASDRTDRCRIPVTAGRPYTVGLWQSSTAGAKLVVTAYSPAAGWKPWVTGPGWPAAGLRDYRVDLPPVPAGVTAVSLGVSAPADSTVVLDDVSVTGRNVTESAAVGGILLRTSFPRGTALVTNEFAYWSPKNPKSVVSPDWEMTSGSLFARGGAGYTGRVDAVQADAASRAGTDSAIFRLNTRNYSFGNVAVTTRLNVARLSATKATPKVAWDGVHIFLHYQSQFELYYASVARRDGVSVIKKKCRGGKTNGGSYYEISPEIKGQAIPYGKALPVGATIRTNPNGSVTISLLRGGRTVVTATDTGVGCAPITRPGATGLRGDNAEFTFADFAVRRLG